MKVAVIGGGASGLVSAIYAAKEGNEVILIERNSNLGKKLLITGNGRCNYFNSDMDLKHYYSKDLDVLSKIITKENEKEILAFFENIGIVPKIKNGYYYPMSNKAISVRDALVLECKLLGVQIITDFLVKNIEKKDTFVISSLDKKITADKVILALGSKAYPKTGSEGIGYDVASSFGHSIIEVLPSLTGLCGNDNFYSLWKGCRCEVKLSLYEDNVLVKEEEGEAQFTDYGISGICAFNLSSLLNLNKKEEIHINFIPFINAKNIDDVISYLNSRSTVLTQRTTFELLEGLLDYKLINVIIKKSMIDPDKLFEKLTKKEIYHLATNLYSFKLNIIATKSFDNAQVCKGGVKLSEINPLTMESLLVKDLYITGELLDVNGDCGGYNLAFAFISGMLAGKGTK